MADLSQTWSGDLALTQSGDLTTASGPALGTQRVLRRLLTNPGAYLWHLDFGTGLAAWIGAPAAPAAIATAVRSQLFLDAAVAADPAPVIELQPGPAGALYLSVRYADAETALPQTLNAMIPGS